VYAEADDEQPHRDFDGHDRGIESARFLFDADYQNGRDD